MNRPVYWAITFYIKRLFNIRKMTFLSLLYHLYLTKICSFYDSYVWLIHLRKSSKMDERLKSDVSSRPSRWSLLWSRPLLHFRPCFIEWPEENSLYHICYGLDYMSCSSVSADKGCLKTRRQLHMKFNKSVDFFIQAAMKLLSCMCFTLTMFLIIYGLIFKATDIYLF